MYLCSELAEPADYGVVAKADHSERTCTVHWYKVYDAGKATPESVWVYNFFFIFLVLFIREHLGLSDADPKARLVWRATVNASQLLPTPETAAV